MPDESATDPRRARRAPAVALRRIIDCRAGLRPRGGWLVALAVLVLVAVAGTGPHRTLAQGAATALSPEEAVISLIPYEVKQADLPAGYDPGAADPIVPAVEAANSNNPTQRLATLERNGLIVGFDQTLSATVTSTTPEAELIVYLMSGTTTARAYATDPSFQPAATASSRIDPVAPGISAGDASSTVHIAITQSAGNSQGGYEVRWQRGRLVFVVITIEDYGSEHLADAQALVTAVDKKATAAGLPPAGPPTVAAPATEEARLDAAQKLTRLLIRTADLPAGYALLGAEFVHPAVQVLSSNDPQRALQVLDQRLQRVMTVDELLSTGRGSGATITGLYLTLDADAGSAAFDLTGAGTAANAVSPPLTLGDQTLAFQYSRPESDGSTRDDLDVYWQHGPMILNVEMLAPSGGIDGDAMTALMQRLDDNYSASVFAVTPGVPASPRATAGASGTIRLDWIDPDANADGYAVVSADSGEVAGTVGANAVTYTVSGLQPGTYCFQVYGYDPAGSSDLSSSACAMVTQGP